MLASPSEPMLSYSHRKYRTPRIPKTTVYPQRTKRLGLRERPVHGTLEWVPGRASRCPLGDVDQPRRHDLLGDPETGKEETRIEDNWPMPPAPPAVRAKAEIHSPMEKSAATVRTTARTNPLTAFGAATRKR